MNRECIECGEPVIAECCELIATDSRVYDTGFTANDRSVHWGCLINKVYPLKDTKPVESETSKAISKMWDELGDTLSSDPVSYFESLP